MRDVQVEQQEHGYRDGHQLLSTSVELSRDDQDAVDRLSDMAGSLRPGETFEPYLTAYPLPSRHYYVMARTWQDLAAPRAGCVLTRSILIPMSLWGTIENLDGPLSLLVPVDSSGPSRSTVLNPGRRLPPAVHDRRTIDLVEAVFIEKRQPIVLFDAPEAEAITVRFLTALWPSLRQDVAACTYALAPRKVQGRYFDLVFAPRDARSRFAGCPVRRIEGGGSRGPRHPWATGTAFQIFQTDSPSLAARDPLGVLANDAVGDESALRVVLLWNELAAKAKNTPTAVLGMLDILNSQRKLASTTLEGTSRTMAGDIRGLADLLPESEAWPLLVAVLRKLPSTVPPLQQSLQRQIEQSVASLTHRNPGAAFEFIEAETWEQESLPVAVSMGLGNGLSSIEDFGNIPDYIARLSPYIGLSMLVTSSRFARGAVAAAKREPQKWIPALVRLFQVPDRGVKSEARRRLVPLIDDDALAPLLSATLQGVAEEELVDLVIEIGRRTKFEASALYEPLTSAVRDAGGLRRVREVVADQFGNEGADGFLFKTLCLNEADITWLCDAPLGDDRARRLLLRLLSAAADDEIVAVQRDGATRERILGLLLGDLAAGPRQVARILTLGWLPVQRFLEIGLRLSDLLEVEDNRILEHRLLERAFAEAEPGDPRILALLKKTGTRIDPEELLRMTTNADASSRRIGDNLVMLETSPGAVRRGVVERIAELSDRVLGMSPGNLGEAGYIAWGALIHDAGNAVGDPPIRVAMRVLSFSLPLVKFPVSALIVATFPIVYTYISTWNVDEEEALNSNLGLLSLRFVRKLGRVKSARGRLVRELLDAFLKSSWPAADLLVAATGVGIEQQVLRRLRRRREGDQYIAAIELDSHRLSAGTRTRIQESLSKFRLGKTGKARN